VVGGKIVVKGETARLDATLAVAADYANVASDGKLNVMGIFQEFSPDGFPAVVPQIYLVVSWTAGPAEFGSQKEVRIAFVGPDNAEHFALDYQLTVPQTSRPGERVTFHQILGIGGLPLTQSGPHAIYVLVSGEEKASVPLYVNEPSAQIEEEVSNGA